MPGLGRYPCKSCRYVANNRRMLARHVALIHSEKVFKCPICPFVTRYAANWYRHKRDIHGLNKVTTCDTCGFLASGIDELVKHKEASHPELLQVEKYEEKYNKERTRLSAEVLTPAVSLVVNDNSDRDPVTNDGSSLESPEEESLENESISFSLPSNGFLESGLVGSSSGDAKKAASDAFTMNDTSASGNLRPLKVRRSYSCDRCGLLTNNPREYLCHLQSIHGEKINIHECKYCIYASKHVQKLQRHCNLVHRQQLAKDPAFQKHLEVSKEKKGKTEMLTLPRPVAENTFQPKVVLNKPVVKKQNPNILKCSACPYQTRNKSLLFHHEKTVHFKKKFYRCPQCGYVTNEKGRYTKHIKYHSLPKMQCEFCFFKTAYKWNMDRHMKNHEAGAEGEFRCNLCNFTTSTKQSYKAHVTNHHDPSADDVADQDIDILNNPNGSSDWEDIDFDEAEPSQFDENASFDTYEFPDPRDTSESGWKDVKQSQKNLQCKACDFKASWPFELKKHEETHKSQKKHPCPLCGMRFEHIAWLTKHLRRVHRENTQAKSYAAAFDLMKPTRRRPGREYNSDTVVPMFQDVLKNNNKPQEAPKTSMLSSLLKKPLQPLSSPANRYSTSYKSRIYGASQSLLRQQKLPTYYEKPPSEESFEASDIKPGKSVPTCNVCGYKTRWISELQRHMRVHSQEKPFHCSKCKYHCKWKGDLNRHLMKYHNIKMPPVGKKNIPKFKLKKSADVPSPANNWKSMNEDKRSEFPSSTPRKDQESPLDLTLAKETFPHPYRSDNIYDAYDFDSQSGLDSDIVDVVTVDDNSPSSRYSPFKSPLSQLREASMLSDDSSNSGSRRKYQCPFCTFGTTTASRFHVHIVQHYNRRPFMCSVCGYNSNWEWDITKHIRLKGCRDKSHNKACVLLTDESGRRNYEKYEKYLTDIDQEKPPEPPVKMPEVSNAPEPVRYNPSPLSFNSPVNKSCSYDFRNIGSNFEEPQDMPENIVVTPDIDLSEPSDMLEDPEDCLEVDLIEGPFPENMNDDKQFYCKHCNFKHATKRVVISHLSVHAGIKPFRCRVCGFSSNWRHVIVRHVKDCHNGYMNDVEDRINFVQEGYALRLTSVNNEEPSLLMDPRQQQIQPQAEQFGCKICPYKCDKEFYMKFHMKQHRPREGAIFRCDFCPYFVKFKKTLTRHMKLHNVPLPVEQTNANTNSYNDCYALQPNPYQNDMYDIYDNMQTDSAEDSIVISFDKLNQVDHVEHTSTPKIKRHICDHCPYKTDNKTQYLYHKQFHRPNPTAPFKCTVCTYWATMQHLLTQHMKVHSDADSSAEAEQGQKLESPPSASPKKESPVEEPPEMPEKEEVDEKISVVYVKRGDVIVKMFKCLYCPMMNKKKANVRVHQKMHGVVVLNGKFACTYCNYQCLNQGGLTNHIKVHQKVPEKQVEESELATDNLKKTPELPVEENRKGYTYFCMKCPAVFKSSSDLTIHSKFHGASLPFPCPHCDYNARHRPHLSKHMTVHGPEYLSKRRAAENQNQSPECAKPDATVFVSNVKKVDQMLLLEASEMKAAFRKKNETSSNLHKCVLCPSVFVKTSTLAYHISLHGSDGEFKCSQCDYAVSRSNNLTVHSQVHPKKSPVKVKRTTKTFPCTKCPAIFYKMDRYDRHQLLHGQNYKFQCEFCDYSVRFAANLIKHRTLHLEKKDSENADPSVNSTQGNESLPTVNPLSENSNFQGTGERKTFFVCDRCPYFQARKDAVQSHQRRHWLNDGFVCPYCDYSSMQTSFLQNHIKIHITPNHLFPPHAFIKYKSFKIYCNEDGKESVLFDDEDMKEDFDDSIEEEKSLNENPKKEKLVKFSANIVKSDENSLNSNSRDSLKRKHLKLSNDAPKSDENSFDSRDSLKRKHLKLSDTLKSDENSVDSNSSNASKVPVVVLSDIFGNKKDLKKLNQLKIPKYNNLFKTEPSKSKDSSGSLVLKIKLKNCLVNKHDKPMYSVTTSSCDRVDSKTNESYPGSTETTNDSFSDGIFENSNPPKKTCASPIDIEENTLTSNSGISDCLRATDEVNDIMDSIGGPEADDLMSSTLKDMSDTKSDDSFSNDTVPVVVGEICEKLGSLGNISFKSELSLSNGNCSNSLTNGLMSEEIKVKL